MKQRLIVFSQLLPVILSMLILSAHFLRYANMVEVAICIALPFLLLLRRKIVVRILQLALVIAAVLWADTVMNLIAMREQIGYAWTRMAIILGGVILFTLSSGFVFYTKTLRERYGLVKGL
ncbi:MAG: hypothetical protein L3J19_07220 [Sulfurimonas sp.]|nr:hypothetical protein [Sulfurimonas sp.]